MKLQDKKHIEITYYIYKKYLYLFALLNSKATTTSRN